MTPEPFEITRWGSSMDPTPESLEKMLHREGLSPTPVAYEANSHSGEMTFETTMVRVLISGRLEVAIPGYGSISMHPGDILEIQPGLSHEITVDTGSSASVLEALREY